jgi:hypothetical protein
VTCPSTPIRGVARAAPRRACLPTESALEVPFCTAVRIEPAVVLARYSVTEWVRSIDDAGGGGPCSQHRREVAPTDTYGRGGPSTWRPICGCD